MESESADALCVKQGHLWARRRDGRVCVDCGKREFGFFPVLQDPRDGMECASEDPRRSVQ